MKKIAGSILALILTLSALTLVPPKANAQGPGLVSAIISKMERNRRTLNSLRAQISMSKWNAQTREEDRYSGTLAYRPGKGRNSNLLIEWTSPAKEILAVNDGAYTLYRPRLNMAYVGKANSANSKVSGILGFGLDASSAQLRSAYDVQFLEKENLYGGVTTDHLKFVPKGVARYKYAEVWVDDSGMPVQTKVVERNGDATTVRLMKVQRNAPITTAEFKLNLPDGVRRVPS